MCTSVRVCVMVCAYTIQTFTNRIDQAPNKRTMKAKLRSNGWTTTSTMHTISHLHLFSCYIIRLFVFIYLFVYFMLLDFCFFSSYFLPCHFITSLPSGLSVSTYSNIYSYNTISVQYNLYVYDAYSIFIPLWNRSVHLKHCVCEWVSTFLKLVWIYERTLNTQNKEQKKSQSMCYVSVRVCVYSVFSL